MQRYVLECRLPLHLEVEKLQVRRMAKGQRVEQHWTSEGHLLRELPFALQVELGWPIYH
jgi:hypothetical protein